MPIIRSIRDFTGGIDDDDYDEDEGDNNDNDEETGTFNTHRKTLMEQTPCCLLQTQILLRKHLNVLQFPGVTTQEGNKSSCKPKSSFPSNEKATKTCPNSCMLPWQVKSIILYLGEYSLPKTLIKNRNLNDKENTTGVQQQSRSIPD